MRLKSRYSLRYTPTRCLLCLAQCVRISSIHLYNNKSQYAVCLKRSLSSTSFIFTFSSTPCAFFNVCVHVLLFSIQLFNRTWFIAGFLFTYVQKYVELKINPFSSGISIPIKREHSRVCCKCFSSSLINLFYSSCKSELIVLVIHCYFKPRVKVVFERYR